MGWSETQKSTCFLPVAPARNVEWVNTDGSRMVASGQAGWVRVRLTNHNFSPPAR